MELEDKDLSFNYRTHCDPRLNYEQSLGGLNSLEIGSKMLIGWTLFSLPTRRRILACRLSQVKEKRRKTARYLAFKLAWPNELMHVTWFIQ